MNAVADVDESFTATRVAPMPDVTPYHGPDGLLQILADWIEGFDDFEMRPEEFIEANHEQVISAWCEYWREGLGNGLLERVYTYAAHT